MMFYVPGMRDVFAKDGVSVGGLGIFVIISYAMGHLLAALGNVIEKRYWDIRGGMPSDWIVGLKPRLLSSAQIVKVEALTASRLGLILPPFAELTRETWYPVFRQIYSDVEKHGKSERGDTFNGIYGLNRGLCAAALALAVAIIIKDLTQWCVSLALVGVSAVFLYRMQRFGVHYAREIYNQFLLLPAEPEKPKKPKTTGESKTAGKPS
jgi:hypothetical protein